MRRGSTMFALAGLALAIGCKGPKDAGTAPTVSLRGNELIVRHPGFVEARLQAKVAYAQGAFRYELRSSSFPELAKAVASFEGESSPVPRSGQVVAIDVSKIVARASVKTFGAAGQPATPEEKLTLEFFDARHSLSTALPEASAHSAIELCLLAVQEPCTFAGDAAAAASPPGVFVAPRTPKDEGTTLGASTLREIDWIVRSKVQEPRPGRTCRYDVAAEIKDDDGHVVSHGPATPQQLQLQLLDEELTVIDRRTKKVLQTAMLAPKDACPKYAKFDFEKGLTLSVTDAARRAAIEALRLGQPIAPAPSASGKPGSKG